MFGRERTSLFTSISFFSPLYIFQTPSDRERINSSLYNSLFLSLGLGFLSLLFFDLGVQSLFFAFAFDFGWFSGLIGWLRFGFVSGLLQGDFRVGDRCKAPIFWTDLSLPNKLGFSGFTYLWVNFGGFLVSVWMFCCNISKFNYFSMVFVWKFEYSLMGLSREFWVFL